MRFLADMGISPEAVAWLRAQGHDAVHVAERSYHRRSDADILELARQEDRIVRTHDLGFGALMSSTGSSVPSIIIFRLSDMRPVSVIAYLQIALTRHGTTLREGAILSLTERRIRVRKLPL